MKRAFAAAIGILSISAAAASAQTPTGQQAPAAPQARTAASVGPFFVDANGDGICDNYQSGAPRLGRGQGRGNAWGRGGRRLGPQDGSGFGAGSGAAVGRGGRTGVCDGTGPKGNGRGRGWK